jgi:putative DNA primase/helicase
MMIPRELTEYKQWVLWRRAEVDGRKTKIPLSPWSGKAAACYKPQTWSTFNHVCHVRRRFRADGIGFVFTVADPFCGIDLDRCRTATEEITAQAADVIRKMN